MSQTAPLDGGTEPLVPDDVIPHHNLPPLRYRDLPEPISWKKMLGPSLLLAGLALGSGEFMLWPHITYKAGFIFFWACLLGVTTQFFLNLEIERYTLATGESVITGFCRLSRHWAWIFLIFNVVPLAWPGWASGAGTTLSWLIFGAQPVETAEGTMSYIAPYSDALAVGGLLLVGVVLTSGPVVYSTVEKIQTFLVAAIVLIVVILACMLVEPYAVTAMVAGAASIGSIPDPATTGITFSTLLGALAFAGAGGTLNLGQSNYIKDKGYGMGKYIGRITSPITGSEEAVSEIGYHFPHTEENLARWRKWWRATNIEHFFSFFVTCVLCLALLSLISYSIFYDADGTLKPGMDRFGEKMNFVWGEAMTLQTMPAGQFMHVIFLLMGTAIFLTTELGVLDVFARISADIVKVNWLRDNDRWSLSKLYYLFLWAEIALGVFILVGLRITEPKQLIVISAAMQGLVMFVYSLLLLWLNNKTLPRVIAMSPFRKIAIAWAAVFFGYFSYMFLTNDVWNSLQALFEETGNQ